MDNQTVKRDLFDFEVGYLTQSPCVNCEFREHLPQCHKDCIILDQIQTRLVRVVSSQSSRYDS